MKAAKTKTIAVWGLGNHAIKNILPALDGSPNLELHGVYSRDKKIRDKCSKNFKCISWESHDEMLLDPDVSIIYLATPPGLHYSQGLDILNAGKHFWCEKPFTTNAKDARTLIEIADKKGLTIAEGLMYLYHPQFKFIKKYFSDNKSSDIKIINSFFTLPHTDSPGFRYNPDLGGSTLLDIGIYPISLCHEIIPYESSNLILSKCYFESEYKVDTSGFAVYEFASGTICNLFWGMGFSYRNQLDILTTTGSLYTEKIFSKPSNFSPVINLKDKTGNQSEISCEADDHFISMFENFVLMLNNQRKAKEEKNRVLKLAETIDLVKSSSAL